MSFSVRLLSCLMAWLFTPAAQTGATEPSQPLFARVWRSNDGLPSNEVTAISQDASGYLWIAYRDGLVKFDGVRFQNVPLPLPHGREHRIRAMTRTSGDRFWLALDGGTVICIAPQQTNVFTAAHGFPNARPFAIVEARDGAIWIGYNDASACRLLDGKVTRFTSNDGLADSGNCRLASDIEGRIWFAQTRRIGVFNKDRFETLLSMDVEHIRISRARSGGVWICADSQVFHFEVGGTRTPYATLSLERGFGSPDVIHEDRTGAVWIGTYGDGLFRCTSNSVDLVETSQKTIFCLHSDREGSLWVGTAGGGLNRIRPRVLTIQDADSGLPFESARSLCVDGEGTLWAGARNGALARYVQHKWHVFGPQDGWSGEIATCLTTDRQGSVWIGTYRSGGLYRWRIGTFERWGRTNGLAGGTVCALLAESSGKLWIGLTLPRRLQVFENGQFRTMNSLPQKPTINCMAEDASNRVWIALSDGTLLRASESTLLDQTPASVRLPITRMLATPDGSLWLAYLGGTLGRIHNGEFHRIAPEAGLPNTRTCDMIADARGGLWFSTDQGILRISQQALESVADGRSLYLNAIYYGSDELLSLQGNLGYGPGVARAPNGDLYFPTLTGLAIVHPDGVATNRHPPQVVIESIRANDRVLSPAATTVPLRIGPKPAKLEFAFTAPSFIAPASVRFRHMLEGVDSSWIDLGTQRRVTYTQLPPGDYTFKVTACDYAGLWNDVGDHVRFRVEPYFWQTLPFKVGSLALLSVAMAAFGRFVMNRGLRRELRKAKQEASLHRERARIAKDIHDDLGANLTQISLLSELARRGLQPADPAATSVTKLSETARKAFTALDEIVWAVNPSNDTLTNLLDYLAQFALDFLSPTQIRCRIDFPSQPPSYAVAAEARHALYLVLKEALNNVVKHARATEVQLRAGLTRPGVLQLVIIDNGIGFSTTPKAPEADGLGNMQDRMRKAGGHVEITSGPDRGTEIICEVPITRISALHAGHKNER